MNMNKILLYISCFTAVISDMLFVVYAKSNKSPFCLLIIALIINFFGCLVWTFSMKKGIESSMAITSYALFTVTGCSLLGVIFFNEQLSIINIIGIIMALTALILMNIR